MNVQGMSGGAQLLTGTNSSLNALRKTNRALAKILEQLSTAKRINSAADDAAGLGIAEQLTTQIRGFKQASQNIADATAALDIAEGAGNEISDMLQRQRELALQAKNGTLSPADRQAIDREYQAITQEIGRVTDVTNYNGRQVANGTDFGSGKAQIQVGPNAGETITIPTVNYGAAAKALAGSSLATPEAATAALGKIDSAINTISGQRTLIGATMNRLTHAGDNLANAMTNTQAAESIIRDEDMATGMTELTTRQLLQQGALATFSRYNEVARNHILGLLQ